jgi:hypothetical protein
MNSNQIPQYANTINNSMGVLSGASAGALNADTNTVDCFEAGANGSIVKSINIITNDTSDVDVILQEFDASNAVVRIIGVIHVPTLSGTDGVNPAIDALSGAGVSIIGAQKDNQGKYFLQVEGTNKIKASVLANMTGGGGAPTKECYINIEGRDYES